MGVGRRPACFDHPGRPVCKIGTGYLSRLRMEGHSGINRYSKRSGLVHMAAWRCDEHPPGLLPAIARLYV